MEKNINYNKNLRWYFIDLEKDFYKIKRKDIWQGWKAKSRWEIDENTQSNVNEKIFLELKLHNCVSFVIRDQNTKVHGVLFAVIDEVVKKKRN